MSVSLYDAAVVKKIKSWVIDPNMTVLSPDDTAQLFKQTADQKDGQMAFLRPHPRNKEYRQSRHRFQAFSSPAR